MSRKEKTLLKLAPIVEAASEGIYYGGEGSDIVAQVFRGDLHLLQCCARGLKRKSHADKRLARELPQEREKSDEPKAR